MVFSLPGTKVQRNEKASYHTVGHFIFCLNLSFKSSQINMHCPDVDEEPLCPNPYYKI